MRDAGLRRLRNTRAAPLPTTLEGKMPRFSRRFPCCSAQGPLLSCAAPRKCLFL
jgi:hypothetical protein